MGGGMGWKGKGLERERGGKGLGVESDGGEGWGVERDEGWRGGGP